MLPRALSEGLVSLNPAVDRRAMVYETTLAAVRAAVPGSLRAILPGERDLEYTAAVAGAAFGDAELEKLAAAGNDLIWLDSVTKTKVAADGIGSGAFAPNEARKRLFGLGPKVGGESPYLQQQNSSLEALAKRDATNPLAAPPSPARPAEDEDDEDAEALDRALVLQKAFTLLEEA